LFHTAYVSPIPVISVGNITLGGNGKTPFTIYLAQLLIKSGYRVAVSHRDYKGAFENKVTLLSDFDKCSSKISQACDEAALLAEKLHGVPVIAGKDRTLAIRTLADTFPTLDFIILDDSFQHLKIKHDLDILIFNTSSGIGNGFVLPAGILREPVRVIKLSDLNIVSGDKIPTEIEKYKEKNLYGHLIPEAFFDLKGTEYPAHILQTSKNVLLSAIGNPLSFENTISKIGINFLKHFAYPDHYSYKSEKWQSDLKRFITEQNAEYIITTEKDIIKLKNTKLPAKLITLHVKFCFENSSSENILLSVIKSKRKTNNEEK